MLNVLGVKYLEFHQILVLRDLTSEKNIIASANGSVWAFSLLSTLFIHTEQPVQRTEEVRQIHSRNIQHWFVHCLLPVA